MHPSHSKSFPLAGDNGRIVTYSSFQASLLAEEHAAAQIGRQAASWQRPAVQSIDVWLASCWQDVRYSGADVPLLLSPWQENLLWREVIEEDSLDLLDTEMTAQLARRSASTITQWHIPLDADEWSDNADAFRFRDWYVRFKKLCSRRGFVSRADLWTFVPEWIAGGVYRPEKIVFWGFHQQSPAFRSLVSALGNFAKVAENTPPRKPGTASVMSCETPEQEAEYAARWVRSILEGNSTQSVAVFVPNLPAQRSMIARTFRRVFHPSSALRFDDRNTAPSVFHIAASGPLDEHPIVSHALLLLELGKPQITLPDASAILRCPFISGAAAERGVRAQADVLLRRERELEVSLRQLRGVSGNCPRLSHALDAIAQLQQECSAQQDLPSWSEFIGNLLQTMGWPGNAPLTKAEEEVVECWNSALSTLGTLGMVSNVVSYQGALAHLRRILSGASLEVGDWSSPVQILDTTAAAGLNFERAFAMGLSKESWPSPSPLSSLIPVALQFACKVTGSSPSSVQEEHRHVAAALFSSAAVVTGVYSGGRLSPFAEPYVRESADELTLWAGKLPRQSFNAAMLEAVPDDIAPIYRLSEDARGGTGIIKTQSLCPFRAFAEYRLNAAFPDDACFGFDSLQRGGFLHRALEFVWEPLQTQARLLALSEPELRAVVKDAVAKAIAETEDSQFHRQAAEVERERVADLVFGWLTKVESMRPQPFTVEKVEGERVFHLGGLRIRLRIDRIDRLENGRLVLIDYKSGQTSLRNLDEDRPKEPQLLIYAAALGSEVDGIFFGQLKPRNLRAVGYSRERQFPDQRTGVLRERWDGFLETSQENVERLAREFAEGRAAVDPLKGACEYCGITPLCRIQEVANAGSMDEGE